MLAFLSVSAQLWLYSKSECNIVLLRATPWNAGYNIMIDFFVVKFNINNQA